jgi:hypothetical protein
MATFCPSTKLIPCNPRRKPAIKCPKPPADALLKNPITGIADCPRTASGHAAAPPSSVMKSRRFI